jgi:hypothetical protein
MVDKQTKKTQTTKRKTLNPKIQVGSRYLNSEPLVPTQQSAGYPNQH